MTGMNIYGGGDSFLGTVFCLKISEKILLTKWVNLSHIVQGVANNFKNNFQKSGKNFISFLNSTQESVRLVFKT